MSRRGRPHTLDAEVLAAAVGKLRATSALVTLPHDRPADPPALLGVELLRAAVENA